MSDALVEHRFWLQILGDHGRFIYNALAPSEKQEIQTALYFINSFDGLLRRARQKLPADALITLSTQASHEVANFKQFKLHLLRRELEGMVGISLSPTFFNHMLNELEEYEVILKSLINNQQLPILHPVHLHEVWLSDAAFHAVAISANLDGTEKQFLAQSNNFRRSFEDLYLKNSELKGYLRTGLQNFPALSGLNLNVEQQMTSFIGFLTQLEQGRFERVILGTYSPLVPDHMSREECYYLTKLAQVTGQKPPGSDPSRARNFEKI